MRHNPNRDTTQADILAGVRQHLHEYAELPPLSRWRSSKYLVGENTVRKYFGSIEALFVALGWPQAEIERVCAARSKGKMRSGLRRTIEARR